MTAEHRLKISQANKGVSRNKGVCKSEEHKAKIAAARKQQQPPMLGKHHSKESKEKIASGLKGLLTGEKNPNWKGGITEVNAAIRNSRKYKKWRKAVFERDNHTCTECPSTVQLIAHHIKAFALYPSLRYDINNGKTLCKKCHMNTDNFAGRTR